jgi:hypothetical protein
MKRLVICAVGTLALLAASPARATITIGQLLPAGATAQNCGPSSGGYVQATVTSGNPYAVPPSGVRITSWSTAAIATTGQQLSLILFRPLGGSTYLAVTHDGPHPLAPSAVNTFPVNIPVQPGDLLGLDSFNTNFPTACGFQVPGETGEWNSFPNPPPPDGTSGSFNQIPGNRVNVSAEVEPTNSFSLAGVRRNKKKGKATVTVNLSGPGTASLAGKGLKSQSAALSSATGGPLELTVIPGNRLRKKLRERGKAAVQLTVTFTPTGGTPATLSQGLKLVQKH